MIIKTVGITNLVDSSVTSKDILDDLNVAVAQYISEKMKVMMITLKFNTANW